MSKSSRLQQWSSPIDPLPRQEIIGARKAKEMYYPQLVPGLCLLARLHAQEQSSKIDYNTMLSH